MRGLTALQKLSQNKSGQGELARPILAPHAKVCSHEITTLLPDLLCAGIGTPLLAICAVAIGARPNFCIVHSLTVRQPGRFPTGERRLGPAGKYNCLLAGSNDRH